jgi:hypothetical protein
VTKIVQLLETSASVAYSSLVFRQNSTLAQQVNEILIKFHEPLERLRQKYVNRLNNDKPQGVTETTSLPFAAFSGLFVCVSLLTLMAICSLCIERKISTIRKKGNSEN